MGVVRFYSRQDYVQYRGSSFVGVKGTAGEDPRADHLIERAEHAVRDDAIGHVGAEDALGLARAYYFAHQIHVVNQVLMGKLGYEPRALADFGLHHNGQVTVRSQSFKVQAGEHFELGTCGFHGVNFALGPVEKAAESGVDGFAQDVVFVLEIEIDGAVGDAGSGGNLGDARIEESMLGDDLDGSVEDALMLVPAAWRIGLRRRLRAAVDGTGWRYWTLQTETLRRLNRNSQSTQKFCGCQDGIAGWSYRAPLRRANIFRFST